MQVCIYLRYIILIVYMYSITHGVIDTNANTRVVSSVEVCNMCLQIIVILYSSVIIPRLQHTIIVTAVMFRRTVCKI